MNGTPDRRGDTRRYGPLILGAARAMAMRPDAPIHVDRVLAVLTDTDAGRLAAMTWGELCAVVALAVAMADADRWAWRVRAATRGYTTDGHARFPTWCAACGEAVADDTLDALADRGGGLAQLVTHGYV
jgi:hypothetical protein